jgi:hypothetical protein
MRWAAAWDCDEINQQHWLWCVNVNERWIFDAMAFNPWCLGEMLPMMHISINTMFRDELKRSTPTCLLNMWWQHLFLVTYSTFEMCHWEYLCLARCVGTIYDVCNTLFRDELKWSGSAWTVWWQCFPSKFYVWTTTMVTCTLTGVTSYAWKTTMNSVSVLIYYDYIQYNVSVGIDILWLYTI